MSAQPSDSFQNSATAHCLHSAAWTVTGLLMVVPASQLACAALASCTGGLLEHSALQATPLLRPPATSQLPACPPPITSPASSLPTSPPYSPQPQHWPPCHSADRIPPVPTASSPESPVFAPSPPQALTQTPPSQALLTAWFLSGPDCHLVTYYIFYIVKDNIFIFIL